MSRPVNVKVEALPWEAVPTLPLATPENQQPEKRKNDDDNDKKNQQNNKEKKPRKEKQPKQKKVVGPFRQVWILIWKNWILFKRNILGSIVELFSTYLFLIMLVLLRFFADVRYSSDETSVTSPTRNVIDNINTTTGRTNIYYYPNNALIQGIVTSAVTLIQTQVPAFTATVSASTASSASSLSTSTVANMFALVSFPSSYSGLSVLPNNVEYTIYTQEENPYQYNIAGNLVDPGNFLEVNAPEFYCSLTTRTRLYNTLFDPIKVAVDFKIIQSISGTTMSDATQVKVSMYYCPSYTFDIFKSNFSFFLVIIIEMAYLFTFLINLKNIIVEKETKMKEYLKLVGIKWYSIWIAWIIRSFLPYLILTLLLSIISIVTFSGRESGTPSKAVFGVTNYFIILSCYFVYSVQVTMFTLLMGQIFSNSFVAKTVGVILWLLTSINLFGSVPSGVKYLFCIFPNWGLLFCIQVILQYERSSKTFGVDKMYNNLYGDPLIVGYILLAQMFWTLCYIPLTWYIEKILPGEYGAPLPLWFPFLPSYWFNCKSKKKKTQAENSIESGKNVNEPGFEKDPSNLNATISIQNMTKKFRLGFKEKTAVNNMSINFYENQITGLLGHNGAGKTTTTFMLCGIYAPTSGDAFILGKSIKKNLNEIRQSLGFCPQYNILYDQLTVAEHIDLIASIKGYSRKEIKEEILKISAYVGLEGDLKKKSKQLSGGMKRRLSVAMSLTGGSKIIILDEPTSGLDPFNRRSLWELIRKFKKDRSIILTTHFMEEADALSDRIAIMNHGKVKCCGSPLFLKNTFGSGYRLTLSKGGAFNEDLFRNQMASAVGQFSIETNIAAELCINIPFTESAKLPQLLQRIEVNKSQLGINGYGISSPTIEEVFIKVGSIDVKEKQDNKENFIKEDSVISQKSSVSASQLEFLSNSRNSMNENKDLKTDELGLTNIFSTEYKKNKGFVFWCQQLFSLWLKRFRIFYRRYILMLFILLVSALLTVGLLALIPSQTNLVNSVARRVANSGSRSLTMTSYGSQTLPYYLTGAVSTATLQNLLNTIYTTANKPGITLYSLATDTINDYVLILRKSSLYFLTNNYFGGMSLSLSAGNVLSATFYYSSMAYNSAGSMLNEVDNLILQYMMGSTAYSITTYNSPIASADTQSKSVNNFIDVLACIDTLPLSLLNFFFSLAIAFLIAIMTMHVARERMNGSKQLQYLSGTHYMTYWISNFIHDWPIFVFNIVSLMIVLLIMNAIKNDTTNEIYSIAGDSGSMALLFFLLIVSSFSWISLAYVWSFFFKSDIVGFISLLILLSFISFLDVLFIFAQLILDSKFLAALRVLLALFVPNVTVKQAMFNLKIRSNTFCIDAVNFALKSNYAYSDYALSFVQPGIGTQLIFCLLQFIGFTIILILIEVRPFKRVTCAKCKKPLATAQTMLEEDVEQEQNRVKKKPDLKKLVSDEPLVVYDLKRQFKKGRKKFMAVNGLSFGISPNECFGFLGSNGAGKTTTFKIMTGEIKPSSGKAFVNGFDVAKNMRKARRSLAFCPQFDYLPDFLTVRDTLVLFAGLRGIQRKNMKPMVDALMKIFKLDEFRNKLVQNLSGGNKRKVSSAISFIGKPKLVFMDEPTTGMDPAARRYLWTVIKKARDSGMTIVLTTHSMEECEALSSKLGIMVNGQFKCFGSVQHLKDKFGKGYSLVLKCANSSSDADIAQVEQFTSANIRYSKLKDRQQETLFYQIEFEKEQATQAQSIAELFSLIETNKERLNLETYSLSQTSLEQVFLTFVKDQKTEEQKENERLESEEKIREEKKKQKKQMKTNRVNSANESTLSPVRF